MTTLVTCTYPGGFAQLPLGAPNNQPSWNGGPYTMIPVQPPSNYDANQGVLTNNGSLAFAGSQPFQVTVNAQAWTAFISTPLGQQLTTAGPNGAAAALIAAN
jgi:hypothetical protein